MKSTPQLRPDSKDFLQIFKAVTKIMCHFSRFRVSALTRGNFKIRSGWRLRVKARLEHEIHQKYPKRIDF